MILLDSNSLLVLVLGLMDPDLINTHPKTSIYDREDFEILIDLIGDLKNILVIPNIMTEVDNLLNKFTGDHRRKYAFAMHALASNSSEEYLKSITAINHYSFSDLGITDTLILNLSSAYKTLITSDTKLSDQAKSLGIDVFDIRQYKMLRLE